MTPRKIIYRSAVRPKKSPTPNHRLEPYGGEVSASSAPSEDKISSGSPLGSPEGYSPKQKAPTVFIRSRNEENPSGSKPMPTFDPSDLIGRTFLLPPVVEFWGLPPLILFFNMSIGWFGRFVLSTECYRTRKLGYKNLNWPRCSAQVTESLALTDGSFCQKQNTLYFRLCKFVSL